MPGLDPGIHVNRVRRRDVDGRDKLGHDGMGQCAGRYETRQHRTMDKKAGGPIGHRLLRYRRSDPGSDARTAARRYPRLYSFDLKERCATVAGASASLRMLAQVCL